MLGEVGCCGCVFGNDERAPLTDDDFHPELRRIARFAPWRLSISRKTLGPARLMARLLVPTRRLHVEEHVLNTGARVRLHRPTGHRARTGGLLWIHGGGYVMGSARQDDNLCRRFAERLGIAVASVDYRLAPEHPYPAALEDCYSALAWLVAQPAVDPTRVAIGGPSSGGGLAAALALLARDRREITPALQLLVYPMLDDRTTGGGFLMWTEGSNRFAWKCYLGNADPEVAVPARANDLAGLPPTWMGVGTRDLFCDEDLAYAARLKDAGVPCHVELIGGAFHGFDYIAPRAAVSRAFFDSQCAGLRSALSSSVPGGSGN